MQTDMVSLIVERVHEIGAEQEIELPVDLGNETPLFGQHGLLDSLGLVSLVVAVEQAIEDEYGVTVSLADEKAMSQKNSPYRTIGSLAAYAHHAMQV
ncbi:MAG: acyl carrier protein [Leptolyngbyaceae cyanobacterium bins.302]|nr:acyl carrier protein [Leptolyngbyaceae cyanobacterium bins.302]